MKEWQQRKFGELYKVPSRNGLSKPSRVRGSGYKMINMGELFANDRIYDIDMELVPLTDPEKEKAKVESGDLLFARQSLIASGAGKCSIVMKTSELTVFESHLIRVRLDQEIADPMFYYYYFKSPRSPMRTIVEHCVQAGIKASDLEKLLVKVPPIEEQRKTARVLSRIDKKIEVNKEINENLEQQAQALYHHIFIENASSEWKEGTLSDIADITMGQSPAGSSYNEDGKGEIFFQGRAEFGFRFPSIRLYTTEPKRMACVNDVLMSVRAPVGDINIAHTDCCIGRGLAAIHSKTEQQSFILYTMFALKKQLNIFNSEGTVFGSINRNALNNMPIVIPSSDSRTVFEDTVAPIDAAIRNNYDEICRLTELRDTILPKLMAGELDISDIDL